MSVDWFLIIIIIIMVVMLLIANVYILVHFQHDDDKNTAYFPKFLIIFGLFFAEATVLLLPLDVANNSTAIGCKEGWNTACGNIDMDTLWLIVFMAIIFFIIVLIPYAIYYYEADDGDDNVNNHQWLEALKLEFATVLVAVALIVVLFVTVSKSKVPLRAMSLNAQSAKFGFHEYVDGSTLTMDELANAALVLPQKVTLSLEVSFPVYVTGLVSFIGWFGFMIFCGIGLIALPLDLILAFAHRPKFISADVYAHQKLCLQRRAQELMEIGKTIKGGMDLPGQASKSSWERRKQKKLDFVTINKFKQAVYLLEQDMDELKLCHEEYKNYNPLVSVFKLMLGCIASFVSFVWVLHIGLYMLPPLPLVPFLNSYFIWFDQWFPLFGTVSVGLFSAYLLACAVKGCFKFGMRCFCFALHPMKLHGTYMNSMMFNLGLVLMCAIPAVQFCDDAFKDYGRLTAIRTMMGVQIRYLQGMSFFWEYNIFVYGILVFAIITALFLVRTSMPFSTVAC
jgi:LMBR1 domain-containing protein 1